MKKTKYVATSRQIQGCGGFDDEDDLPNDMKFGSVTFDTKEEAIAFCEKKDEEIDRMDPREFSIVSKEDRRYFWFVLDS
jgi:hypothetical protein